MTQNLPKRRGGPRSLWGDFRRSPRGMIGLSIFLLFFIIGAAAPWLTPYHPLSDRGLADNMARPAWMRFHPGYRGAPITVDAQVLDQWHVTAQEHVTMQRGERNGQPVMLLTTATADAARMTLEYPFTYVSDPPDTFIMQIPYSFETDGSRVGRLNVDLVNPSGERHTMFSSSPLRGTSRWTTQRVDSRDLQLKLRLGYRPFVNLAAELIDRPGEYRFVLDFTVDEGESGGAATFTVGESRFRIPGQLHGLLGTDHLGADLWAQFSYGTRMSLIIGFVVAALAVLLGTLVGIVSGYVGRWADELLMRVVDVLISIPFLPILIVVVAIVGKNIATLIVLIAVFSWMGTARLVRSQALSLRERTFVEAARAAGASPGYIMVTHILPHVLGLVFASLVLLIPGAIVTEATLSFLGFGDPRVPTWGRMLQTAKSFGAFGELAWWWILPPGLALTTLAMAFVFMGNTLDDIVNRRSKER